MKIDAMTITIPEVLALTEEQLRAQSDDDLVLLWDGLYDAGVCCNAGEYGPNQLRAQQNVIDRILGRD